MFEDYKRSVKSAKKSIIDASGKLAALLKPELVVAAATLGDVAEAEEIVWEGEAVVDPAGKLVVDADEPALLDVAVPELLVCPVATAAVFAEWFRYGKTVPVPVASGLGVTLPAPPPVIC